MIQIFQGISLCLEYVGDAEQNKESYLSEANYNLKVRGEGNIPLVRVSFIPAS